MSLFFELNVLSALTDRTVLLEPFDVLFPALALFVLLMKAQGTQPVSRLGTKHCKYCAFTSWHMGRGYGFLGRYQEKTV